MFLLKKWTCAMSVMNAFYRLYLLPIYAFCLWCFLMSFGFQSILLKTALFPPIMID